MNENILTGIKPTGIAHLGNYFGAIKPAIELTKHKNNDKFYYFIADYHALTTIKDAEKLKQHSREIAAVWLACGLNPKQVVFYKQSKVPEIFELQTILSNVTPKGLMNRAHAYKAQVDKNIENKKDEDSDINMGLYNYPILMASDILLFNTKKVPVGADNRQHIEMARDIAKAFNKNFKKSLVVPRELIKDDVAIVKGLDGRKMSKSYNNVIELFASEKELHNKIKKIKTDSTPPKQPKDPNCTLMDIYKLFANEQQINTLKNELQKGISWAKAKDIVFNDLNEYLKPMREKYNYYINNPEKIDKILERGSKKARKIAKQTLDRVKQNIGVK
ncbi:MAG: tryptophan--tRNA ligase [Candidatus Woesearchaeota archaeon]